MIDIHAHILPGIDDGSRSMDESIEIIKKAKLCGVTDIIVTPHYIAGSKYVTNNESNQSGDKIMELKEAVLSRRTIRAYEKTEIKSDYINIVL